MKKVLVLDFGGQYNLLVARRVRECGVYCEIKSYQHVHGRYPRLWPRRPDLHRRPRHRIRAQRPHGGQALFEVGIPVLGICYGQQLMMHLLGGQCRKAEAGSTARWS